MSVWDFEPESPKNPCNGKCSVSSRTGYCESCFLTLREVKEWDQMSTGEKVTAVSNSDRRRNSPIGTLNSELLQKRRDEN